MTENAHGMTVEDHRVIFSATCALLIEGLRNRKVDAEAINLSDQICTLYPTVMNAYAQTGRLFPRSDIKGP
jgi:hypothetical protein